MDELKEYLKQSRAKRDKSVKKAKKILIKIKKAEKSSKNKSIGFPSITPKKFRKFEQDVSRQIQGFFYPHDLNFKSNTKQLESYTRRETYSDIYLNFRRFPRVSQSSSQLHKKAPMNALRQRLQQKFQNSAVERNFSFIQNHSLKPKKSPRSHIKIY